MVNGNYVLYGDRPSSESEIVDDHVQTRTAERKNKRKPTRTANELQRTLNMAQLDNETDSIKYEKKVKEPRLLRYVPTTDVEENFVTEKFETYDLKPTEERPRRYAFQKKPKNPADGSVNYAYSRSSSSCSSPNGNLPTISEHGEQYGTYRAQPLPSPRDGDIINQYENKIDKYFYKPKEVKSFASKVNYEGSHPDSLYRVQASTNPGVDKMMRVLRVLRWPVALVAVCIALAVFVYFLMPDNIEPIDDDMLINRTFWNPSDVEKFREAEMLRTHHKKKVVKPHNNGPKTPEIDFYSSESDKNSEFTSIVDTITEASPHRVLPIKPVFPSHIAPEVQYGNERADADKLRTPKALDASSSTLSDDSTLKPHITQKPEKPLAVYFKEAATTTTETFSRAETANEFPNYGDKQTTKKVEVSTKSEPTAYKEQRILKLKPLNIKQYLVTEPEMPAEVQEYYSPPAPAPARVAANFTSGHSKLFGISIEDAGKMQSTTQSSLYNTRVSPTLPTWRDGDDTTTKHYPANINNEAPLCRSTRFQLCREILPYDLAGFPMKIGNVDVSYFLPHMEYLARTNCSDRVKHFACALLEPECNPRPFPPKKPCYSLCRAIVDACDGMIPRQVAEIFNCKRYTDLECINAKAPCFEREFSCGDGTCIPRDWMCDNTKDCPGGEDEAACTSCAPNEYRCSSGGCILSRWVCDGYADCPAAEDEAACERRAPEPGEESAGSAPAPVVHRLAPHHARAGDLHNTGEFDNSKELLVTSDSNNGFKRNFTRRPSLSRLTPYTRSTPVPVNQMPPMRNFDTRKIAETTTKLNVETTHKPAENHESMEDINIGDLGFFEELNKTGRIDNERMKISHSPVKSKLNSTIAASTTIPTTKLDKTINKLEKVIDGAALLKKTQEMEQQEMGMESPEANNTSVEKNDDFLMVQRPGAGQSSAHASPCPSGELRCVDGRCITLAQLCDGTIDCTDHADEDNCYT